ncbi:MAG: hypothetical protein L3J93_02905, partial [Thermoplasmata archaeon]|nr:hypothetical protein [Thermoplasmata archaeon]
PASGLRFTLNTGIAPFAPSHSPGLVAFSLATTGNAKVGFSYDWIGPQILPGPLTVTVVNPGSGSIVGGCATANLDEPLGSYQPNVGGGGLGCAALSPSGFSYLYQNIFAVHVTNAAGKGIYNAIVTAQIPQISCLAWVGSIAESHAATGGQSVSMPTNIISQTFTNLTGYALVETWTMSRTCPYFVNATYGPESGGTVYTVRPPENIRPLGYDNGKYAAFNAEDIQLWLERKAFTNASLDSYIPNFTNQTGLYTDLYGWQGQVLHLHVNNYTGASVSGRQVWLGSYDVGREYRFTRYQPSAGVAGIANSSGTSGYTDSNGNVAIKIPDNMSDRNFFGYIVPSPFGIGAVAVSIPGTSNQTFQYNEKCSPNNISNPAPLITCQFNNSYYRNYTATPLWILPNPLNVTTMTPQHVRRDFFGTGTNISFLLNISLPTSDPVATYYFFPNGYNGNPSQWSSGLEHVTGVTAYVDGNYAGNFTPESPPQVQFWAQYTNLSGNYTPGIHELTVYVTTSLGQEFSFTHRFIVGSIVNENLASSQLYTPLPYNLSWAVNIPAGEISNVTFNSSLEISYVSSGCGITGACEVVNYSIKVHPHQTNFNQSINATLLNSEGFYSGDHGALPAGQYNVIVWFNANHSGSARQSITTYFVFDPLQGQITGPTASAAVPLGNVTIAYTYQGGYITNATLEVFQNFSDGTNELVYTQLAFIPALGSQARTGSATWTAVSTGPFWISIVLGAPYAPYTYTSGEKIQVINTQPPTQITHSNGYPPLFNVDPAALSTALALAAGIIGLLLGLWVAPVLRPAKEAAGAPTKAWDAGSGKSGDVASTECSICHERFETGIGLQQHRRIVHGIEE